ncbi:MAG: phage minor head protein [Ruminococcus sp.]
MKTEAEQLWYYIAQLRRIAAHREAGAEQSILKIYQGILQKLFGILGQYYTAYGKEDAILTRGDLQAAGQYKNFLQAVLDGLGGIASEVQDEIRQAIEETYTTCYNGMVAAVQKSHAANPELSNLLQGLSATTPETVRHIVEHPMENLTLSTVLNRQRKQVVTDIKKTISVGLANGDSYTRMAQRISDSVGKDYRKAMRIVRTEANRAINRGFQDVSEEASDLLLNSEYVEVKEWCSMEDESVRDTHRHLNGKVIHVLDVFHSKGRTADCPCAFGVPEEDIHCRCFLAYRFMKREEFLAQGGVIPDSVLQKEAELRLTSDEESSIIEKEYDSVQSFVGFENLSREKSESLEKVVAVIPEKTRTLLQNTVQKITLVKGRGYSTYCTEQREIVLDADTAEKSIIHELGHAFAAARNLYADQKFLDILKDGLCLDDWGDTIYVKHPFKDDFVYILRSDKFINSYQGRIYPDSDDIDFMSEIKPEWLQEYISIAFDTFFSNPNLLKERDVKLFEYLEEIIE